MNLKIAKVLSIAAAAVLTVVATNETTARPVIVKDITPAGGLVWQGAGTPCTNGPGYCRRYIIVYGIAGNPTLPVLDYTHSGPVQFTAFASQNLGELGVVGDKPIPSEYVPVPEQEVEPTVTVP